MKKFIITSFTLIGIVCLLVLVAIADGAYKPNYVLEMVLLMLVICFSSFMAATYPGLHE